MSTFTRDRRSNRSGRGDASWAWTAVVLIPISFMIAFAIASGLYSAIGHDPSRETPPHWADAVALIPAGIVFAVPCVFAIIYGRRAAQRGDRSGYVAATIGLVAAIGYGILNVV